MPKKILIVDDEPNIVLSLEYLMLNQGYRVATVANGEDALVMAGNFRPHLVILDVMLPAVDGFEVCRRLCADPLQQGIRILMLTARGRATEMSRGLGEGADAYLSKPFATQELVAMVNNLLEATAD